MPTDFIPAGEWNYDRGYVNNGTNFYYVVGMVSEGDRYVRGIRFASNTAYTDFGLSAANIPMATYATMHIHPSATIAAPIIYVDNGNGTIHRMVSPFTATTSEATGLTANKEGCFVSYGDKVIWTNLSDEIKSITDANFGASTFAKNNVITTPDSHDPKAKYLATVKNHLVIANIDLTGVGATNRPAALSAQAYPDYVWWSKTDDPSRFGTVLDTPTITGSGYVPIADDYGAITGIIGGDYALIFKKGSIYRLDGPPFTITPIAVGVGTLYNQSICKLFGDTYFWSEGGPAVVREDGSFEYLTKSKISKLIDNNEIFAGNQAYTKIVGTANHKKNTVTWFPAMGNFTQIYGIEYNAETGKFGQLDVSSIFPTDNAVSFTCKGIASIKSYPNYSVPYVPGSEYYAVALDAISSTQFRHRLAIGYKNLSYNDGVNVTTDAASVDYPLIKLSGEQDSTHTKIDRIRPVWRYHSSSVETYPDFTFTITTQNNPNNTNVQTSTYSKRDANGWYTTPNTTFGAYHGITMNISFNPITVLGSQVNANDEGFVGLEIEYSLGPLRG